MRILHTSDWHFGRSFGPVSLAPDQEAFVAWLLDVVDQEQVDLVVVAGDLYDRSIPPPESVVLMRSLLLQLHSRGVAVVAIAGNHDGAERVSAYDGLIDSASVYLRGGYARAGEVLTMQFDDGPIDVVAVAYLDPILAPVVVPVEPGPRDSAESAVFAERVRRTHQSVLSDALATARRALTAPRSIVVAHAFVTGGEISESERFLTVGGTGQVDISTFGGFSYVALGHLHRPQQVGDATRRYSGAPLPYSFSEQHAKQVVIVDIDQTGGCDVREITVPVGRAVATIVGTMHELLGASDHEPLVDHFIRAVVTDTAHVIDAKAHLRARYPHIIEVVLQPAMPNGDPRALVASSERALLSPAQAVENFWREVTNVGPDEHERALIERLLGEAAAGATET